MRRSFKFHLFLQVMLAAAFIIGSNRLIAQNLLTEQLQTRLHKEMGVALATCGDQINERGAFLSCFKALEKGGLFSNMSDFYVLCGKEARLNLDPASVCHLSSRADDFWKAENPTTEGNIDFAHGAVNGTLWYAAKINEGAQVAEVWLESERIDELMLRVWALRDRNIAYVLPMIILSLLAMALYITYLVMKPIRTLENSIAQLTDKTLDQTGVLKPPYKEFETLVRGFDDLRIRLNNSFIKARRFASDASHELRTPLTILRGNVEQAIQEFPLGSGAQIRMRAMGDEVERLIEITEKLLLLSRADANSLPIEFVRVDLSRLVEEFVKDVQLFQSALKIESEIQQGIVWDCDPTLIRQILQNLYANAVNYNLPNGWIRLSLHAEHGRFQLIVENTAAHIPPDFLARAYDRFYRGDASHGRHIDGLGLGLSICQEIAKFHETTLHLSVSQKSTVIATLTGFLLSA